MANENPTVQLISKLVLRGQMVVSGLVVCLPRGNGLRLTLCRVLVEALNLWLRNLILESEAEQ